MKHILTNTLRQLPYIPQALRLVRAAAGRWTLVWLLLLGVQGLLPVVTVYLTKAVIDSLAATSGKGYSGETLKPVLFLVGLTAVALLAAEALKGLAGWVRTVQSEQVQDHIHGLIHEKALTLDMAFFDSPDYYDCLHRARYDAISRPAAMLENIGAFLQNSVTLVAMGAVLARFGLWLPLLLIAGTFPALAVVCRNTVRFHAWRVETTTAERRCRYYDWLITDRYAAAELRLFDLGASFRESFAGLRNRLRRERAELAKSEARGSFAAGLFGLATLAGAMVWMAGRVARGFASLGDLTLFYLAFSQGQRMMRDLLAGAGEIYRNLMFLENLFEYLNLEPFISAPEMPRDLPEQEALEVAVEGVSFRYPGALHSTLEDFNMVLPHGRIVAVVGENGSGKSTLIKLLCRFYDPDGGRILFNGTDLRDLSPAAARRRITVLFQEPVRYHETAAKNIAFGDRAASPGREEIAAAAVAAGAEGPISRLPEGYETLLGKWFGGSELSVGEWQRLALARAFLRRASLIILDEPTSAMDSWTEADWLRRFRELVAGKTALVITHRFTTALQADVIHVMERGRIIESGSHEELLAAQGRYASSWTCQVGSET